MKILCTADIHIGRRAARLPGNVDKERFSTAAAWRTIVDYAIENGIDLLLLAGDIVDRENHYFEAYGPLEAGLKRLAEKKIHACAVAGNHDSDVFKKLADALGNSSFSLLGRNGTWERKTIVINKETKETIHIDGWSFPRQIVRDNPLLSYPSSAKDPGAPLITMFHCDLGQTESNYAPVTISDLEPYKPDLWLLGHIHKPDLKTLRSGSRLLCPGSPMAMDPGEKGKHGPWILTSRGANLVKWEQVPLSRIRYEEIEVSLDGIDTRENFEAHVSETLRKEFSGLIEDPGMLELLCTRIFFSGRTRLHNDIKQLSEEFREQFKLSMQGITAFIDKVVGSTAPPVDLEKLSRGGSAPALLSRILLEIEGKELSEGSLRVIKKIEEHVKRIRSSITYGPLNRSRPPSDEDIRSLVKQSGLSLLAALLEQGDVE